MRWEGGDLKLVVAARAELRSVYRRVRAGGRTRVSMRERAMRKGGPRDGRNRDFETIDIVRVQTKNRCYLTLEPVLVPYLRLG